MKQTCALILALGLLGTPVVAQEDTEAEGFSLMEEGARLMMRGLMREMEPAISDMREMGPALGEFAQSVGPAIAQLLDQVDDLRNYDAPEILPNGDIILRRLPEAPVWDPQEPDVEIDL